MNSAVKECERVNEQISAIVLKGHRVVGGYSASAFRFAFLWY